MNCQEFSNIIDELADYRPMNEALRDAGVSHAALCSSCAASLAKARSVSSLLVQAARAESEEAPAGVKSNLMAAFAAQVESEKSKVESKKSTVEVLRPVHSADFQPSTFNFRLWLPVAIAAVILLAVVFPILRRVVAPAPPPNQLTAGVRNVAPASPAANSNDSAGRNASALEPLPKSKSDAPVGARSNTRRIKRPRSVNNKTAVATVARNTTEYLPLTYVTDETAIESGTVVRVELSRSALASLGFSTGIDSSKDTVKAEVILGDDGVARAIRLVE